MCEMHVLKYYLNEYLLNFVKVDIDVYRYIELIQFRVCLRLEMELGLELIGIAKAGTYL